MTPEYPSSTDTEGLCGFSGFFMDGTGASERREGDDADDADEEDDLSPEPLLYTNIKLVTMVTMMMPLTPWHWRDTWNTVKLQQHLIKAAEKAHRLCSKRRP